VCIWLTRRIRNQRAIAKSIETNNIASRIFWCQVIGENETKGNSYEMATLLVSMLIGAGHPALVVSGVAREETILNDQLAIPYPYPIVEVEAEEIKPKVEKPGQKYKLSAD